MKSTFLRGILLLFIISSAACTKDKVIPNYTAQIQTTPTGGGSNNPDLSLPHVNEFLAKNTLNVCPDSAGGAYTTSDWIEIYNPNNTPYNIGGFFLTDSLADKTKFQIPNNQPQKTTIPARGFMLIWCDNFIQLGPTHTTFSLSKSGEQIGFFKSDTTLIDTLSFGPQTQDISYGRTIDGGSLWKFLNPPTPGATNY
jgi:hypothetical protein